MKHKNRPIRSALFVPGNRPDRVDKAIRTKADLVIMDLEDAVPVSKKKEARSQVLMKISQHKDRELFVRVNAWDSGLLKEDLGVVVDEGLSGIMTPKLELPEQLREIDALLFKEEKSKGMIPGSIQIIPLIETAMAVQKIFEIAKESKILQRVITIAFGAADFCEDLGIEITRSGKELLFPRARMAVACRAADTAAPLDTPSLIDLKDFRWLEEDAKRAKSLGFQGKLCIHPDQVNICNRIFSPTEKEIARARKVVEAFNKAEELGLGAIQLEDKLVDYAIVKKAKRILELASCMGSQ